jgi:hypothetical protein
MYLGGTAGKPIGTVVVLGNEQVSQSARLSLSRPSLL